MNRIVIAAVILCITLSACGGSSSPSSSTTTVVSAATTTASPATDVSVPFANVATTTTIALSRDARLAVERCRNALGQLFASQIGPLGGGHKQLKETEMLCDEASLQLEADNPPTGSAASEINVAIKGLQLSLGFADLKVLSDKFDIEAEHTLQAAVDLFDAKVDEFLAA